MSKKDDFTAKIISEAMDFAVKVTKIMVKDSRYDAEAYGFVMAALQYTLARFKEPRHVSGRELSEGIREYGLRQYGPMTRTVLEYWGMNDTADFGEIVFNLVEAGLMKKTPEDSKNDFRGVYDFETAFDRPYRRSVTPRISAFKSSPRRRKRNDN